MARFVVLLFLCAFMTSEVFAKKHNRSHRHKNNPGHKIVGGEEVPIQDYPHQAFVLLETDTGDEFQCGGSIISDRYILTAAHCMQDIVKVHVRIGSSERFDGGTNYVVENFLSHPDYESTYKDYDIALLKTAESMDLDGTNAKTVTLAEEGDIVESGTMVTATGWGATVEGGHPAHRLRAVELPIVSREECDEKFGNISERQICGGYKEGGKATCQGDSGGPIILSSDRTQVAIVSSGYGCARPDSPGIYTFVPAMRSWIRENSGV